MSPGPFCASFCTKKAEIRGSEKSHLGSHGPFPESVLRCSPAWMSPASTQNAAPRAPGQWTDSPQRAGELSEMRQKVEGMRKHPHENQDRPFKGTKTESVNIEQNVTPFDSPRPPASATTVSTLVQFVRLPHFRRLLWPPLSPRVVWGHSHLSLAARLVVGKISAIFASLFVIILLC